MVRWIQGISLQEYHTEEGVRRKAGLKAWSRMYRTSIRPAMLYGAETWQWGRRNRGYLRRLRWEYSNGYQEYHSENILNWMIVEEELKYNPAIIEYYSIRSWKFDSMNDRKLAKRARKNKINQKKTKDKWTNGIKKIMEAIGLYMLHALAVTVFSVINK